jgi:hypothetical protein
VRTALQALLAILAILAPFAIVVFFPSAWRPAFLALLLLVVFAGFYFGYRFVYCAKSK